MTDLTYQLYREVLRNPCRCCHTVVKGVRMIEKRCGRCRAVEAYEAAYPERKFGFRESRASSNP